jgi:nucleoside-diphosphate-sugar epimerase
VSDENNVMVAGGDGSLGSKIRTAFESAGARTFPIGRKTFDLRSEADAVMSMLLVRPSIVLNAVCDLSNPASAFRSTVSAGMNLIHAAAAQKAKFIHLVQADKSGMYPWEDLETLSAHLGAQEALSVMCKAYANHHSLRYLEVRLPRLYGQGSKRLDPVSIAAAVTSNGVRKSLKVINVPLHKDDSFELMSTSDAALAILEAVISGKTGTVTVSPVRSISSRHLMDVALATTGFSGEVKFSGTELSGKYRSPYPGAPGSTINVSPAQSMEASVGLSISELLGVGSEKRPAQPRPAPKMNETHAGSVK